ncbi:MAG: hypothetical protein EBY28_25785, partial [Betaproteobacteria bacterium]|nr:hypothetical protein [Betaproteobacteria bacterium]
MGQGLPGGRGWVRNRVLGLLVIGAIGAALSLSFVTVAPNRLVSGAAVALQSLMVAVPWDLWAAAAVLVIAVFVPATQLTQVAVALAAALLFAGLAGLAGKLPMELNGAFCTWISSGLALTGLGLVGWALESRAGPLSLETPQGRFADAPLLAAFFLLFGLSSIGLPGTLSFVADDLLVSGSLDEQLHAGLLVIAATVLSAIAVMRGWLMVFGGPSNLDGPRHHLLPRERIALTALFGTIVLLGL